MSRLLLMAGCALATATAGCAAKAADAPKAAGTVSPRPSIATQAFDQEKSDWCSAVRKYGGDLAGDNSLEKTLEGFPQRVTDIEIVSRLGESATDPDIRGLTADLVRTDDDLNNIYDAYIFKKTANIDDVSIFLRRAVEVLRKTVPFCGFTAENAPGASPSPTGASPR